MVLSKTEVAGIKTDTANQLEALKTQLEKVIKSISNINVPNVINN
jgi:hypothetical protein